MTDRYVAKANALVAACIKKYGAPLPFSSLVLIMAVAEHETNLGDAWNHSGNWGAIQLTFSQMRYVPASFREDHHDSDPVKGPYVTAFWRFPDGLPCPYAGQLWGDMAGAWMLLEVLLEERPSIKAKLDSMSTYDLAAEMYATHYYGGVHDPRRPGGAELNIQDYAKALEPLASRIGAALASWTAANTPTEAPLPGISGPQEVDVEPGIQAPPEEGQT